ncbi:hypothetical protein DTO282E5_2816 [Paecilomyces variotii]|nr:hypothetical protein DTO282E5_2816 [Paecilomyces variotii]
MAPHRRQIGASRRRRQDEGEDEGSTDGFIDDSLSETSIVSNQDDDDADGEGSDVSDDETPGSPKADPNNNLSNGRASEAKDAQLEQMSGSPGKPLFASTMSDTEAMLNGMKISHGASKVAEIQFDDMKERGTQVSRTPSAPPTEPRSGSFTDRRRRDQDQSKERGDSRATSTSGGFSHGKRSAESSTNGYKPFNKSKSRPYGLIVDGNIGRRPPNPDRSEGQWTHDLHETVATDAPPAPRSHLAAPNHDMHNTSRPVPTAPRSSPPNRSFSSTVLIGNVPAVVFLPGMESPIQCSPVQKRQHTRLPQHRPPLRRDKPVRISVPGQPPRYIFPATERSFIFIPRALRPNQQAFRARGRGGFHTGQRSSFYGAYSPSHGMSMSRRSSLGRAASREGVHSPAGSVRSRQTVITTENGKPVVRLPPTRPPAAFPSPSITNAAPPGAIPPPPYVPHANPAYRESRPAPIPMHQPRPQKTVSVADIESPASFPFNPPQPQKEQPFHQQVPLPVGGGLYGADASGFPPHSRHTSHHSQASGTPLSQIPERAIHAVPFQPYGFQQSQPYYPAAYQPGAVFYPPPNAEYPPFSAPVGPAGAAPAFVPAGQQAPYVVPATSSANEQQPAPTGTVAHEAGGTVYFYDTTQMYSNPPYAVPAPGPGGVVGMGGMMTPPTATYYYPQPPPGVYYPPQ